MHKLTLVLSLVGFASVASAQDAAVDLTILIEDASGVAVPASTGAPDAQPTPSGAAVTRTQASAADPAPTHNPAVMPALPASSTYERAAYATPRLGYGLELRAPAIALEIERLRAERPGLAGPLTLMLSGAANTVWSGFMAELWASWECDDDHCGRNPATIGFGTLAAASGAAFVGALVALVRRAKQRRRIARRIRELELELELELARGPAPAW